MGILFNCSKNRIKNPPINSQSRQNINNRENNILQIQLNPKDNNINTLRTQSNLKYNYNNSFPEGTEYEQELSLNFKYLNVFWFDPNKTNDFEHFAKSFENVKFFKSYDLDTVIKFFTDESVLEWIIITPGSKGEEIILKTQNFDCIKAYFVFCKDTKIHKKWAKKYKKVECITSNIEIICQKFIEINKNYIIPNFNYKKKDNLYSSLNYISSESVNDHYSSTIKKILEVKRKDKSKYSYFCIKSFNYLKNSDIEKHFMEIGENDKSPAYTAANLFKKLKNEDIFKKSIDCLKNMILLSLYFNQYRYIFNLLTFNEVKNILIIQTPPKFIDNYKLNLEMKSSMLCNKITNNYCLLDEEDYLKNFQIDLIHMICYILREGKIEPSGFINFYQIVNFFRDIDFCLKFYLSITIGGFSNKRKNFVDESFNSLMNDEIRYALYSHYHNLLLDYPIFNKKNQIDINKTLRIKDFIVVGDNKFNEKIKIVQDKVISNSFVYKNFHQIQEYLEKKKKDGDPKKVVSPYFYILIIRFEEFKKYYENLLVLTLKSGITFLVFIYIENEKEMKFNKNQLNFIITPILVYSPEDILNYLSQKLDFINILGSLTLKDIANVKIPKITFEQNEQDEYQDGCFELAETFDFNLIKNNFILCINKNIDFVTEFTKNIYYIYKEHNALDLFFKQNCPFFGWTLYPEIISTNICFVKRFLYMYCREEKNSKESFYRIINEDLMTRDSYKISRYINILALINKKLETKFLENYKGKVYRATKLDEKLILKLIPGKIMINTTFWSTSKKFQVAEGFMIKNHWRNSYICCETIKNNIDIDSEGLNPFNEYEVLLLPFTEFKVEKVSCKIDYGKKIYIIELTELGNQNFVNIENMNIEYVEKIPFKSKIENYYTNKGINYEDLLVNNLYADL